MCGNLQPEATGHTQICGQSLGPVYMYSLQPRQLGNDSLKHIVLLVSLLANIEDGAKYL